MDNKIRSAYKEAEATEFPSVDDAVVWCSLRGLKVPVEECATSCVAPEMRPACWGKLGPALEDENTK